MAFVARYPGTCFICEGKIEPGDPAIYTDDDELAHVPCEDRGEPPARQPVCSQCWTMHAGECL